MDKVKRCCFAGHREVLDGETKNKIKEIAVKLIKGHNVTEFWVGNYGRFDACAALAIRELKDGGYPEIKLNLIIPYLTKEIENHQELYHKNYDKVTVADLPLTTPKKFWIIKANEYMVDNSDFLICYIDHDYGGAYRTYSYAKSKKLEIFNVADNAVE